MGKRIVYTKITPLPSNIPRQLALDMLHSHAEVIQLNPLVTGVKSIEAPRDAANDEFFSQWYEITEIITWGFGLKNKITFKGCFHDQPWGLQSHVYAPMGTDMRNKYRIGGNQPGEPREPRELGVDTPLDGLYLREDVDIMCSVPLTASFVKKEAKSATGVMINRLTRKAELLDEGKLHAMFEDGRLKTSKPSGQPTFAENNLPPLGSPPGSPQPLSSPSAFSETAFAPPTDEKGYGRYHDIASRQLSQRHSTYAPQHQQQSYIGPQYARQSTDLPAVAEMPGSFYQSDQPPGLYSSHPKPQGGQVFRSELPGDFTQTLAPPPIQHSPSPGHQFAPYNPPQLSPQIPQNIPSRPSSTSAGSHYKVSNPDYSPNPAQHHPAYRHSSGPQSSQQVADWQRGLYLASSDDPNSIRNSTYSNQSHSTHQPVEPDHQRFSQMSIQQQPTLPYPSPDPNAGGFASSGAGKGSAKVSKCPVCQLFEGNEVAISHHLSEAHGFK